MPGTSRQNWMSGIGSRMSARSVADGEGKVGILGTVDGGSAGGGGGAGGAGGVRGTGSRLWPCL